MFHRTYKRETVPYLPFKVASCAVPEEHSGGGTLSVDREVHVYRAREWSSRRGEIEIEHAECRGEGAETELSKED